jgi:hypothetical protein
MPSIPGLRSPYLKVGRLVYFGRMLDKIRLHARGALPADYQENIGKGFDARCGDFLRVAFADLRAHTLAGGSDDEILAWAHVRGGARTDDECEIWNNFMMKRGWRDAGRTVLERRIREGGGFPGLTIETMFDLLDADEGRDAFAARAWEK